MVIIKNFNNSFKMNKKILDKWVGIAIAGAIFILCILISGCVGTEGEKVKNDSVVEVNFTDDKNKTTKKYISVDKKKYNFENELIGMGIGDEKKFVCEDVVSVRLQHEPVVGKIYFTQMGEIKIFRIDEKNIYFGHKLTGETLNFEVKVKEIKKKDDSNQTELRVKKGDLVTVEYVGRLRDREKFDNGTITFVVGAGQMIKGFDEGIIGMGINESKLIVVSPEKGYGTMDQLEQIPREVDIPLAQFKRMFNEKPVLNKSYSTPHIPWPLKIIKINTHKYNCTVKILNILTKEEYKNMSCLGRHGISENDVVFLYSDRCIWCIKMKPLLEALEKEGYGFFRVNIADSEKMKIAQECLSDVLNFDGAVPQFACPATGETHAGAFVKPDRSPDISQLRAFAEECKKS